MLSPWPLSLSLVGLEPTAPEAANPAAELRAGLALARRAGCEAVTLNGAAPGMRARDLDRSARRDLGATVRREGLAIAGLDLWIPASHFADAAHVDRAVSAALAAIELAADLATGGSGGARGVVSIALPRPVPPAVREALVARADATGVSLADHGWPPEPAPAAAAARGPWGAGLDPAAALAAGEDPAGLAARLGAALRAARLSDLTAAGRRAPGGPGSRLDLLAYAASLSAAGYAGALTVDVRQAYPVAESAVQAVNAWRAATRPEGAPE